MPTTFSFSGRLAITVSISGHEFTLVGTADLTSTANMTLEYQPALGEIGVTVGSIRSVIEELAGSTGQGWKLSLPGAPATIDGMVTSIKTAASSLPGFGPLLTHLDTVQVKLTQLRLELSAPPADNEPLPPGTLTIGFAIDSFPPATAPRIPTLNIQVRSITLLVKFKVG